MEPVAGSWSLLVPRPELYLLMLLLWIMCRLFSSCPQVAPARSEKRGSSYLIASPEPGPVEYLGQHAQGSAVRYAESSLKKKRVY